MYPLTSLMNAKYNTLIKFWLPVAAHDEVFLHTILFASALHFYSVSKGHDFKDSDLLMKVILDRLNSRLKTGQLSDATIGAVSCLAICDVRASHLAHVVPLPYANVYVLLELPRKNQPMGDAPVGNG